MPLARNRDEYFDADGLPLPGSIWRHHSGRLYTVLMNTNIGSDRDRFPPTVVYQGQNGLRWSRPIVEFLGEDRFSPEA